MLFRSFDDGFKHHLDLYKYAANDSDERIDNRNMCMRILNDLELIALENHNLKLKEEEGMTLLLDGWNDVSSNSIYGLILLFEYSESDILDILDFSSERHTAENLLLEVSNIVNSSCIIWAQIKCCCTDSPSTLIKFCHLLNERHKHIIVLLCALHALNLMAKNLCKFEDDVPIMKIGRAHV